MKIKFPMGWRIIFFCFFSKKVVIIYYGEKHFFWSMGFPMGWTNFFCVIFFRNKFVIYTMGKTCICHIWVVFVRFRIRNIILVMQKWLFENGVWRSIWPFVRILEIKKISKEVDMSDSEQRIVNVHVLIISKEHTFESFKYGTR